jgi:hypothetical protein
MLIVLSIDTNAHRMRDDFIAPDYCRAYLDQAGFLALAQHWPARRSSSLHAAGVTLRHAIVGELAANGKTGALPIAGCPPLGYVAVRGIVTSIAPRS